MAKDSAPVLPTFNLPKLSIEEATQLEKPQYTSLKEGLYAAEVTAVTCFGPDKMDPTWFSYRVDYALAGDKKTSDFIKIPTSKFTFNFNGKEDKFQLNKLRQFLDSVGLDSQVTNLGTTLSKSWGADGSKLVGKKLEVELKHQDFRFSKNDADQVVLLNRKGEPVEGAVFPDFQAGQAYCKDKGIFTSNDAKPYKYVAKQKNATKAASNF